MDQLINPDFHGPKALSIRVTDRWKSAKHRKNSKVVTTKFTNKSRTRAANLARKVPSQEEVRLRAMGLRSW